MCIIKLHGMETKKCLLLIILAVFVTVTTLVRDKMTKLSYYDA